MLREIPPAVALALVLGAAPASAQSGPASAAAAPEDSTAARTLEQNRRVLIGQPAPSEVLRGMAAGPSAPAASVGRAGAAPADAAGRVGLAVGGRPGARSGS
jgi:hypothetical protein